MAVQFVLPVIDFVVEYGQHDAQHDASLSRNEQNQIRLGNGHRIQRSLLTVYIVYRLNTVVIRITENTVRMSRLLKMNNKVRVVQAPISVIVQ